MPARVNNPGRTGMPSRQISRIAEKKNSERASSITAKEWGSTTRLSCRAPTNSDESAMMPLIISDTLKMRTSVASHNTTPALLVLLIAERFTETEKAVWVNMEVVILFKVSSIIPTDDDGETPSNINFGLRA